MKLQDTFLAEARDKRRLVTVFVTNGYQLKGIITWFDRFTLCLEGEGKQSLIYKSAVSTIVPDAPLPLVELREEGPQ